MKGGGELRMIATEYFLYLALESLCWTFHYYVTEQVIADKLPTTFLVVCKWFGPPKKWQKNIAAGESPISSTVNRLGKHNVERGKKVKNMLLYVVKSK